MTPDSIYISQIQGSSAYDYLSELPVVPDDVSHKPDADATWTWLDRLINSDGAQIFAIVVCVLVLAYLVWLVIKKFDFDNDEIELRQGLGEDTIYGHEWEREIGEHMRDGAYGEAMVLCYLRWLAALQKRGIIVFHQSKTPGMYLDEVTAQCTVTRSQSTPDVPTEDATDSQSTPDARDEDAPPSQTTAEDVAKTETLTDLYLRVRYGHKNIDRGTAERIIAL